MKRISMLMALCFCIATFSAVAAPINDSEELIVRVKPLENKVFKVTVANLQKANTKITLTNLSGSTTYFEENVQKHNGYAKKLDLSELSDGRYLLTVKQKGEEMIKVLYLSGEKVMVSGHTTD